LKKEESININQSPSKKGSSAFKNKESSQRREEKVSRVKKMGIQKDKMKRNDDLQKKEDKVMTSQNNSLMRNTQKTKETVVSSSEIKNKENSVKGSSQESPQKKFIGISTNKAKETQGKKFMGMRKNPKIETKPETADIPQNKSPNEPLTKTKNESLVKENSKAKNSSITSSKSRKSNEQRSIKGEILQLRKENTLTSNHNEIQNLFSKLKKVPTKKPVPRKESVKSNKPTVMIPKKNTSEIFKQESAKMKQTGKSNHLNAELDKNSKSSDLHLYSQSNENTRMSDQYRPINIIWDRSILVENLTKYKQEAKLKKIHALISKVDNALKRYIHLKKDVDTLIKIPKGYNGCKTTRGDEFNGDGFKKSISVEGDLVIFLVAENNQNDVLASAAPCTMNSKQRTQVGRLYLNLEYMKLEYGSYYEQKMEIMTVFHEVLHILAFHPRIHSGLYDDVKNGKLSDQYMNLSKMKLLPMNPLISEGHWDPVYFGNDLMAPIERVDSTLSIFTLEYLDLVSPEIKTDRSVLPNNFIFDEISDFNDFFTYKCNPFDKKAKYSAFCSGIEQQRKEFSCDRSRIYKSICDSSKLSNGCYARESHHKYICSNPMMPKSEQKVFETYGEKSRCFETVIKGTKNHALCLEFEVNQTGVLIKAEGSQYQCTRAGEMITMKTRKDGSKKSIDVRCPDAEEFENLFGLTNCKMSCYGNGFCSNGKCQCFDGYDQSDHCKSKTASISSTRFTSAL
jgi:hypothetical protein